MKYVVTVEWGGTSAHLFNLLLTRLEKSIKLRFLIDIIVVIHYLGKPAVVVLWLRELQ